MMNEIKEVKELKEKLDIVNNKILDIMYNILWDVEEIGNEYDSLESVKSQFIIWENLLEDEFTINHPFGNIDMSMLNAMHERFKKEGFKLYSISDCETRNDKKGLIFYFKKNDTHKSSDNE